MRMLLVVVALGMAADRPAIGAAPTTGDRVLVVVNGEPITQSDLQQFLRTKGVPATAGDAVRAQLLEQLIDTRLIAAELKRLKVKADPETLDRTHRVFLQSIRKSGSDPDEVLKKIGRTRESLKAELAQTLAWRKYARSIITAEEMRALFRSERSRYDGTRLRARQIVFKLPPGADEQAKQTLLNKAAAIRREIVAGKTTFAEAAKLHSAAPSARKGGDVGYFAYRGRLPEDLTRVAFSLKEQHVSQPFVTPYGVHLLQVTDRKPGQLSLEDARPEIFKRLSGERWQSIAKRLRAKATIERKPASPGSR